MYQKPRKKNPYSRAIARDALEVSQKKRSEKQEVRDAAREAALRYESESLEFPLVPAFVHEKDTDDAVATFSD
ncbi:hypothetical protein Tco_1574979 [Tanacetum coccineum]